MAGGSTTTTEPWEKQKDFLEKGFQQAEILYNQGAPSYYQGPTLAGFDPASQLAQRAQIGYALGPRPQAMQGASEAALVRGLSGAVNREVLDPIVDSYQQEMMEKLTGQTLPGIRQNIVQYNPGGSSRADLIQSNAIASAQRDLQNKVAQLYGGAFESAQAKVPQFGQLYPTIMSAPLGLFGTVDQVGQDRRAMAQEAINRDIAKSMYDKQAQQQNLQTYMANIKGDYGGTVSHTPGPLQQIGQLAGLVSGIAGLF